MTPSPAAERSSPPPLAQARWTEPGEWQAFQIERATGVARVASATPVAAGQPPPLPPPPAGTRPKPSAKLLQHGDLVCLRAHTGRLLRCPRRASAGHMGAGVTPLEASACCLAEAQLFEIVVA